MLTISAGTPCDGHETAILLSSHIPKMAHKPDASRPVGIDIGSYWSTKVSAEGGWAGIFDSLYL